MNISTGLCPLYIEKLERMGINESSNSKLLSNNHHQGPNVPDIEHE